jgi:hypothetical protein
VNLRPLGDRVVLKAVDREEMTQSGIVIPDTAKEKPQAINELHRLIGPRGLGPRLPLQLFLPGRRGVRSLRARAGLSGSARPL